MDTHQESPKRPNSVTRFAAAAAIAIGLGVGSYGIASAASGSGTTSTPTATNSAPAAPPGASGAEPWGHQRSDETLGGTIVRVETDADGVAAYEAHMTKADGSPVTVYVDKDFNFVSVQ